MQHDHTIIALLFWILSEVYAYRVAFIKTWTPANLLTGACYVSITLAFAIYAILTVCDILSGKS